MKLKTMTVAEIMAQVRRVEGFDVSISHKAHKQINAKLRERRSDGNTTVSDWISKSFPECDKGTVTVLRHNGKPASRLTIETLRRDYPKTVQTQAKKIESVESEYEGVKVENNALKKKVSKTKRERKTLEKEAAQTFNDAQKRAEQEAARETLDLLIREPNGYHQRVVDLCISYLAEEEMESKVLLRRILAAWSLAEVEKDRLNELLR